MTTTVPCPHCDGNGSFITLASNGVELYVDHTEPCGACRGTGYATCDHCCTERAVCLDEKNWPTCDGCRQWLASTADTLPAPANDCEASP